MRPSLGTTLALLSAFVLSPAPLRAEPDPCDLSATVSPCFDADALWLPTGATNFATLPSARPLESGATTLLFATGLALDPASLTVPSPDPLGREVHVVKSTTTFTIGVGFGLGHGLGVTTELGFVPYQEGTGVEALTAQQAPPLGSAAVRDPRIALSYAALGRNPTDPVAVSARFGLAPPFGDEALLAGGKGTAFLPGLTFEAEASRFAFGADASLRLRQAVDFGSVRKGSEAVLGIASSVLLLSSPRWLVGIEAWLRPGLAGSPAGADPNALDLPAEWLLSTVLWWDPNGPFSLAAAGGSSLPLSNGPSPSGEIESFAGVTAPSFRALFAVRFTPQNSE